ncbi:hypothetical protein AMAG_12758 [Allomyces macrogynus ATCC 38327]|uniref:General transcription and DNA repair factor IIH subunit TFB4 n=1 Tax=Allomyces macrogynus (strain ATCC 38327) TaxID=578462 RepID=A0A0L0T199_ALLM3|nr:hypothetical protein AMAG_12758 [Allomyces macrogynus ATCC 38327]|eukprot:KNE68593.1 hypothetical protein AMAG_12758 [Allomyces macrogynus ATCC 38327]
MEKSAPANNRSEADYIRPAMAAEEGLIKPRGSSKAGSTSTPSLRGGPSVTTASAAVGSDADDVSLLIVVLDCAADQHLARSTAYQQFDQTNNTLMAGIKNLMDRDAANMGNDIDTILHCNLASALSKALCYANRLTKDQPVRTHLLVVSASHDTPAHYVALMNTIFSAQKAGSDIIIDVCKLYGDSFTFLPPPTVRKHLALPTATCVDFRTACFCHQQIVSEGFVCSVCLSAYCKWRPVCAACKTKFPFPKSTMGGGGFGLAADGGAGAML